MKELTSGQCTIYGQWFAILSAILYIILAPSNLLDIFLLKIDEPFQAVVNIVIGCIIILLEIPIFLKCVPSNPKFDEALKFFEKNSMRACLYAGFALFNWICEYIGDITSFLFPSILMTCSAISYGVAAFKNEDRVTSSLTGTSNFIDLAASV